MMKKMLQGFTALLLLVLLQLNTQAQEMAGRISGKVTDANGVPVEGVSIQRKNGAVLGITAADGTFRISANKGDVLIFTSGGFEDQETTITSAESFTLRLEKRTVSMDDVVVVGYGTQKKKAVTGAVASVGFDKFKDRSFANVAQSLQGMIAGVNITTSQGAPGFGPTIKIRGTSSITAGTTPLYVVDGMALENFDLNQLNPQDIQSVEVLKDAASSAIYGSRGANGVILVTTKLGRAGKPQINLTFEQGLSVVNRKVEMMDAQQWIQYYIDARNNAWE